MSIDRKLIDEYTKEAFALEDQGKLSEAYEQARKDWIDNKENAYIKQAVYQSVMVLRNDVLKKVGSMVLMPNELPGISMSVTRSVQPPGGKIEEISIKFTQEQIGGLILKAKSGQEEAIDMFKMFELDPERERLAKRLAQLNEQSVELYEEVFTNKNEAKREEMYRALDNKRLVENSIINIDHIVKKYDEKKAEFAAQKKQEVTQTVNTVDKEQLLRYRLGTHERLMEFYGQHKVKFEEADRKYRTLNEDKQFKADNFDLWYEKLKGAQEEVLYRKSMVEACYEDVKASLKLMEDEGLIKPPTTATKQEVTQTVASPKPVVPARPSKDAIEKLRTLTEATHSTKVSTDKLSSKAADNGVAVTRFTQPQSTKIETSVVAKGLDKLNLNEVKNIIKDFKCEVTKKAEGPVFSGADAISAVAKVQDTTGVKGKYILRLNNCDKSMAMVKLGAAIDKGLDITKCTFTQNGKTQEIDAKEIGLLKKAASKRAPDPSDDEPKSKRPRL